MPVPCTGTPGALFESSAGVPTDGNRADLSLTGASRAPSAEVMRCEQQRSAVEAGRGEGFLEERRRMVAPVTGRFSLVPKRDWNSSGIGGCQIFSCLS